MRSERLEHIRHTSIFALEFCQNVLHRTCCEEVHLLDPVVVALALFAFWEVLNCDITGALILLEKFKHVLLVLRR